MTTDDLDMMQLASAGQKLARLDDTDYLAVHIVLAWPAGGAPALFCSYPDWAATKVARLAAKDQEIAELVALAEARAAEALTLAQRASAAEARIKQLESQLAIIPAHSQAAQFNRQAAYLADGPPDPPDADPIICPDCGEAGWKSPRALQMHRQRAHQGMLAHNNKPVQFVEELGWRCKVKGCAGAHARDLHDTDFCTLHAQPHTNGRLTEGDLEAHHVE